MKNALWTGIFAAATVAATITLGAQQGTSSAPQARAGSGTDEAITVNGCVQRTDQVATGTSGSTGGATAPTGSSGAGDASQKFVLTNVMPGKAAPRSSNGEAAAPAKSGRQFPLAADDSQLMLHVGHQVEITGTFENTSPAPGTSSIPKLKVDSIRMVASSCQ
jgi:hypothetical protein